MTTTINNEGQAVHGRHVLANKGDVFSSLNVEDFAMPHGKDEEWKFAPLCKLHGLHNGTVADPVAASIPVETAGQSGVAADVAERDDEHLGHAGTPTDHVAAQVYSGFDDAHIVTFAENSVSKEPVAIDIDGPGEDNVSYDHIVIDVQSHAEAVCVIDYRGSGTFADSIESVIGDGTKPNVVAMVSWNEDAIHGSAHRIRIGHDTTLHHTVATFGGEVIRIVLRVAFTTPGGGVDLLGAYFADAGQYFESHVSVDHAVPNCRSSMMYKGALQGRPSIAHHETHTAQMGDVLVRTEMTGTDAYELNRNLLLIEGARADVVPNLKIETGEIAGAGHATTVGRLDEEQLFYLLSCGIPELAARRLVVRDFFSEVINLIPAGSVRERLEKLIDEELNTVGF